MIFQKNIFLIIHAKIFFLKFQNIKLEIIYK